MGVGGGEVTTTLYQSTSINQSTLFKHGKWLSKLVFRHAVEVVEAVQAVEVE